jgi:hypothetical protein
VLERAPLLDYHAHSNHVTLLIPDPALKATPFGWLKNASTSWCKAHPLDQVSSAAEALVAELANRRLQK